MCNPDIETGVFEAVVHKYIFLFFYFQKVISISWKADLYDGIAICAWPKQ